LKKVIDIKDIAKSCSHDR